MSRKTPMVNPNNRTTQRKPNEVTLRVRSLITVLTFVSRGIEVPEPHLARYGVAKLPDDIDDDGAVSFVPFRVHVAKEKPANAFVDIRYQDRWYYIDNSDGDTKQVFAFLLYLYQVQAPSAPATTPVLTVPTG